MFVFSASIVLNLSAIFDTIVIASVLQQVRKAAVFPGAINDQHYAGAAAKCSYCCHTTFVNSLEEQANTNHPEYLPEILY